MDFLFMNEAEARALTGAARPPPSRGRRACEPSDLAAA